MAEGQIPKVYISYSWDDERQRGWVRRLAERLRMDGIEVLFDRWQVAAGEQFMEGAAHQSDYVLVVCTPSYKQGWEDRTGAVRYERDALRGEVYSVKGRSKFIPVLLTGSWKESAPDWLLDRQYIDFRSDEPTSYRELLASLHSGREGAGAPSPETPTDSSRGHRSEPPPTMGVEEPAEEVAFTAYHPKEGRVETWHTLMVYTHILSALDRVRKDAQRFADEIPVPKETTSADATRLARGTEITIVPACEGVTFNPERMSIHWVEDFHRSQFRFQADQSLAGDAAKGQISIYVGPLIVSTIKFAMLFGEAGPAEASEEEAQSRMYRQDAIFISYSHKDTEVVLAFKKVHEATGYDVLIDIDDLRTGQEWNPELLRMIDRADIFQLFWSQNSCQSRYCKQEWEYALKKNREGFIRPVYWQVPLPDPPEELSKYHFEYVEL